MKKYIKRVHFIIFCLLSVQGLYAQSPSFTVRGKVIDKADKQAVIGASVILTDKDGRTVRGTTTDIEGNYALPVANPTYRVSVSYLGFKSTEPIVVGNKPVINFQLESTSKALDDVVITSRRKSDDGSGLLVDDANRASSTFKVDAKDLEEMQSASIDQALQGRMPGVDIASISGDPGAPMQIRIRGVATINGNSDPLIVVDGMPYDVTIPEDFNFATSDETQYGQLLSISPSDIKDITVLKDAGATAVYGSRAANGVLVINTKRGVIGKPRLGYVFKGSYSRQPPPIPTLNGNQYSTLISEEFYNASKQFSTTPYANEFQYDKNDPYNYYNYSNNTDWIATVTQPGYNQTHSLSISGGGEKAKYRASTEYYNEQGTTKGTAFSRLATTVNLDYSVSKKIYFTADFRYTHGDRDQNYSNIRNVAYLKMPNQAVYEYDEYGNLSSNYFSPAVTAQGLYQAKSTDTYNPLAMANTAISKSLQEHITPHFSLRYTILPSLRITSDLQIDIDNQKNNSFLPQIATGLPFTNTLVNIANDGDYDSFGVLTKVNLAFTPTLKSSKNSFNSLLSFQTTDSRRSGQGLRTTNTASAFLQDPTIDARNNTSGSASSNAGETRTLGLVFQSNYVLLNRYILSGSARLDGNSKFGPGNRFGLFPAMSVAWKAKEESFLKNVKAINELKFRGSIGQIGNAPRNDYTFYNTYQAYGVPYLDETGIISDNMELTSLKWETKTSINGGLDFSVLKNKLSGSFDIYKDRVTDMFYNDLQIASYNGYPNVDLNIGTLDNQGWEFNLQGNPIRTKNLRIDASVNFAFNQNIIREVSRLYPRENKGKVTDNGVFKTYFQENNPFGSFYGYRFKGIYPDLASTVAKDENGDPIIAPNGQQVYMRIGGTAVDYQFQPGDTMYEDINHDGLIDYKDIVYLGNGNPKFTGGFGGTITYKGNIKLSANFSFRQGNDLINGTKIASTNMYDFNNQSTAVLRRWRTEGDQTDIPRAMYKTGYNYLASDKYVEDGSFIRLRSLTARYDFGKRVTNKLGIKSLGAYLTGENLLTFTKYTGQDPEVGIRLSGPFSVVQDNSTTPPIKRFTLGLTTNF